MRRGIRLDRRVKLRRPLQTKLAHLAKPNIHVPPVRQRLDRVKQRRRGGQAPPQPRHIARRGAPDGYAPHDPIHIAEIVERRRDCAQRRRRVQ